jgi:hypothetical protein
LTIAVMLVYWFFLHDQRYRGTDDQKNWPWLSSSKDRAGTEARPASDTEADIGAEGPEDGLSDKELRVRFQQEYEALLR